VPDGTALGECVRDGIADLNPAHARLDVRAFGYKQPAFLIDASCAVAFDGTRIHDGVGAAAGGKRTAPLGVKHEAEGRVRDGRNVDAFEEFLAASEGIELDAGAAVVAGGLGVHERAEYYSGKQRGEEAHGGSPGS